MFKGAYPISGEDLMALSVKVIAPAVAFYVNTLGFTALAADAEKATLERDDVKIGLVRQPDHKPGEAGSFAIAVDDLDAIRKELDGRGLDLSPNRIDQWNGKTFQVLFLREAENGYCYCFNQLV